MTKKERKRWTADKQDETQKEIGRSIEHRSRNYSTLCNILVLSGFSSILKADFCRDSSALNSKKC